MKVKLILFVLTVLSTSLTFSQEGVSSVKWFDGYSSSLKNFKDKIVFYDSEHIYVSHETPGVKVNSYTMNKTTDLMKLDRNFKPVLNASYKHKAGPGIRTTLYFKTINEKLYLVSHIDKELHESVFVQEVDLESLELKAKKILFDSRKKSDFYRPTASSFFDEKKLQAIVLEPHNERHMAQKLFGKPFEYSSNEKRLRFVNFETNEEWSTFISDTTFISDVLFGTNGDIHLMLQTINPKFSKVALLTILENGKRKIYRKLDIKAPTFNRGKLTFNEQGNVVLYGYTSTKRVKKIESNKVVSTESNNGYQLSGTVFFEFEPLKDVLVNSKQSSFSNKFMEEVLFPYSYINYGVLNQKSFVDYSYNNFGGEESNQTYRTINNIDNYKVIDDGYLLITSQFNSSWSTSTDGTSRVSNRTSSKVIVSKISNKGDLLWSTYVPVFQSINNAKFINVMFSECFRHKSKLHFIYNDHINNKNKEKAISAFDGKDNGYIANYQIDLNTGDGEKKNLVTNESKALFIPVLFGPYSTDELLFQVKTGEDTKLGLLNLKNLE